MSRLRLSSHNDYRQYLREEFEARCGRNPYYSLRSYARDLALSPSRLCEVMKGRYGLSRKAAELIAGKLSLSPSEQSRFCDLVESQHARSDLKRKLAKIRLKKNQPGRAQISLQQDAFRLISDWYHLAIMELTCLDQFKNDHHWIARSLGIAPVVAAQAIERLKRLKLLQEDGGKLILAGNLASAQEVPSEAIKTYHKQVIERALNALFFQPFESRDFSSMVMAVDRKRIPEVKEKIRDFRRSLSSEMEASEIKDSVYCLGIQFFGMLEDKGN